MSDLVKGSAGRFPKYIFCFPVMVSSRDRCFARMERKGDDNNQKDIKKSLILKQAKKERQKKRKEEEKQKQLNCINNFKLDLNLVPEKQRQFDFINANTAHHSRGELFRMGFNEIFRKRSFNMDEEIITFREKTAKNLDEPNTTNIIAENVGPSIDGLSSVLGTLGTALGISDTASQMKNEITKLHSDIKNLVVQIDNLKEKNISLQNQLGKYKFDNELKEKAFDLNSLYIKYFIKPTLESFVDFKTWQKKSKKKRFADYVWELDTDIKEGLKTVGQVDTKFASIGFTWNEISELYTLRQQRNSKTHTPIHATNDQILLINSIDGMINDPLCNPELVKQLSHYIGKLKAVKLKRL